MRRIVTGVDKNGRTCVVEESTFEGAIEIVLETPSSPPPPRPDGQGVDLDLALAPGIARQIWLNQPPNREYRTHRTDSIDFHAIISGYIDLVLDDGTHRLLPGDCAVVTGTDHGWRAGPEGCIHSVVMLGTPSNPQAGTSPSGATVAGDWTP